MIQFSTYPDDFFEYIIKNCSSYILSLLNYCIYVDNILNEIRTNFYYNTVNASLLKIIDNDFNTKINLKITENQHLMTRIEPYLEKKPNSVISISSDCNIRMKEFIENFRVVGTINDELHDSNFLLSFQINTDTNINIDILVYNNKNIIKLQQVRVGLIENKTKLELEYNKKHDDTKINLIINYLTKQIRIVENQIDNYKINITKKLEQIQAMIDIEKKLEEEKQKKLEIERQTIAKKAKEAKEAEKIRLQLLEKLDKEEKTRQQLLLKERKKQEEKEKERTEQQKIYIQSQIQFNPGDLVRYNDKDATINKNNRDGTYNISYNSTTTAYAYASINVNGSALSLIDSSTQKKTVPKIDSDSVVKRKITIDELDEKIPHLTRLISEPVEHEILKSVNIDELYPPTPEFKYKTNLRRYVSYTNLKTRLARVIWLYGQLSNFFNCPTLITMVTIKFDDTNENKALLLYFFDNSNNEIAHVTFHMNTKKTNSKEYFYPETPDERINSTHIAITLSGGIKKYIPFEYKFITVENERQIQFSIINKENYGIHENLILCILDGINRLFRVIGYKNIMRDNFIRMQGGNDKYYLKYLKYKQKYLELKNNL